MIFSPNPYECEIKEETPLIRFHRPVNRKHSFNRALDMDQKLGDNDGIFALNGRT
jgi:hypothetical protein